MTGWPLTEGADAFLLHVLAGAIVTARPKGAAPLPLGVAVSGGGDSIALLHLLHRAAPHAGYAVQAVTVDHGLRPESAAEAAQVAGLCADLDVPHSILRWQGPPPTGNLMDQARHARLSLIADWARARGIEHVTLGHTADDNAESFLMNLGRAAGLDGLSGMRRDWREDGIHWHRPLWQQTRDELRDYLRRNSVPWIDDPSNENDRFTRVKARRALKALKPLGITVGRLSDVIANLSAAQEVVHQAVAQAGKELVTETAGVLCFDSRPFRSCDPELRRRLLIAMVRWFGGAQHPPRERKVFNLNVALDDRKDATLGGVRFRWRGDICTVSRELQAVMGPVPAGQIWDHRWQVTGPADADTTIAALGPEGLRLCPDWRNHGPRDALIVSPGIWRNGQLLAAPLAGRTDGWQAQLCPDFGMFIMAH